MRSPLLLFLALFALPSPADFIFKSRPANSLARLIRNSSRQNEGLETNFSISLINTLFKKIDRSELDAEEAVELKYLTSGWRKVILDKLLAEIEICTWASKMERLLDLLTELNLPLTLSQATKVTERVLIFIERKSLLSNWINLLSKRQDPYVAQTLFKKFFRGRYLGDIPGWTHSSHFHPTIGMGPPGWLESNLIKLHYGYEFPDEGTVSYRGLSLRSGDFILVDLHAGDTGLKTAFSHPRSLFTHIAQFVLLKKGKAKIPAVFEITGKGIRMVPLNVFLSPHFTAYAEVYRPKKAPLNWEEGVVDYIETLLEQEFRYDYHGRDMEDEPEIRDTRCVTCSSLAHLVALENGLTLDLPRSLVDKGARKNLEKLGLNYQNYLTPSDFARSPDLKVVEVLDNNLFFFNLTRELTIGHAKVEQSAGGIFSQREINFKSLPFSFRSSKWIFDHISAEGRASPVLLKALGFTRGTFPDTSSDAAAFTRALAPRLKSASRSLQKFFPRDLCVSTCCEPFLHELEEAPRLQQAVSQALEPFSSLFK